MSVGCRTSLAWGWAFLSLFLHHACSMDMCALPPTVLVDTGVTAEAEILLRTASFSGEACLQYCCTHDSCSAALFSSSNNTCYLLTCLSESLCVGGLLPATTLYLISHNVQNEILHNEIRQLNSVATKAAAATTRTLALTTGATTPTENSASSNTKSATTVATTTSAVATTTTALQTPPPTQLTTQSTQANSETTTTPVSSETLPSQSPANGISTPFMENHSTSSVKESTPPIQTTIITPDVTGPPNATDAASVTETASVTPPPGEKTSQTTVNTPPLLSTTASVNASTETDTVSGRMVDGKVVYAEKRHWSRDWRRKHFQEHLLVKHVSDSLIMDGILSNIFGGGDGKLGEGAGDSRTNSRVGGEKINPDPFQQGPISSVSSKGRSNPAHGVRLKTYPISRTHPSNHPVGHPGKPVFLKPPKFYPYPVPHKIGEGKPSVLQGTTTQQLTVESQATVRVLTSTLQSNESSPTTTTTTSPQSNASTTVISTVPSQTSASGTTTSVVSGITTVTSVNDTTSSTTSSQAMGTTSPRTIGTTTTMLSATDSAESTESTVLVSVDSTPLMSANNSLADIAIEANDRAMSAALIAALSFGILFFAAVLVLLSKRLYDGWQRRHYSRVDYLVNGMYN